MDADEGGSGDSVNGKAMKRLRSVFVMAVTAAGWLNTVSLFAADEVITRVPTPGSNYCRLRFPAIREDTLFSSQPQLKNPSDGDMIDFYGPCDYDPLGRASVLQQRYEYRKRMRRQARD